MGVVKTLSPGQAGNLVLNPKRPDKENMLK
jgi:hypothetical protein